MAICGGCHTEIERRERESENIVEMLPIRRVRRMINKAGVKPDKYREIWE